MSQMQLLLQFQKNERLLTLLPVLYSISAFIGAGVLTFIHGDYIKPFIALFLLSMGFYILYQFLFPPPPIASKNPATKPCGITLKLLKFPT
jgi:uncharacterized membrane protein YfcA